MTMNIDLAATELFAQLTVEEVEFLKSVGRELHFDEGDVLFEEDTPATHFYIVVAGRVGLELVSPRRRPIVIQTLGKGDLVGLSWLVPPHTWSWRARALDTTTAVSFDAAKVRAKCAEDHNLSEQMLRLVAAQAVSRLHAARTQLLDLYEFPR